MKKNFFKNASGLIISALFLTLAFTSCTKQTSTVFQAPVPETLTTAKGSKPGTTAEVSLIMTINDAAGNKITSDNGTAYENGVGNVKVVFDQYGNFMFGAASSNPRTPPMTRYLNYNFSNPLASYPVGGIERGNFISTGQTATSPDNTLLQNLAVNATKCIGLSAGLMNIEGGVVNFHRNTSTEDIPGTPTSFVYVTRISSSQWIMTPVPPTTGGCSTISNVAALRINSALYGYYDLPFFITLTKK